MLTVSVVYLLFRRFRTPVREFSVPSDYLLLFLLFCTLVTGDIISWGNSWSPDGFVITKQDLGQYLSSLLSSRSTILARCCPVRITRRRHCTCCWQTCS